MPRDRLINSLYSTLTKFSGLLLEALSVLPNLSSLVISANKFSPADRNEELKAIDSSHTQSEAKKFKMDN